MNIEELKEKFRKHVEHYDMNEVAINRKFYHSYRVMDFCLLLAKYNDFNEEDTNIAMLVGLLHDYSRFEQWEKYKTYSDIKSVDHGDLAVERLFGNNEIENYCSNKKYYDEIYDAIKYHNKYDYLETLSEHNKLLCRIVRDADKLDIFYRMTIGNKRAIWEKEDLSNDKISDEIFRQYTEKRKINYNERKTSADILVSHFAYLYDFNFEISLKIIKENNYLEDIYKRFQFRDIETKNRFDKIYELAKEQLN